MRQLWPLGELPDDLQRPELGLLKKAGYEFKDPYEVVDIFERKVADFAGSKYGVAIDCCSNGLFLCLKFLNATGNIIIPKCTYVSVPMQILHAGCKVDLRDIKWTDKYQLSPYPIWDAATEWRQGMYQGGLHVVSFQIKKYIPIGRGGMILTNDENAYNWLKRARHDGRDMSITYAENKFDMLGWHYYMTPEDAARGIMLMDLKPGNQETSWSDQSYYDLSHSTLF